MLTQSLFVFSVQPVKGEEDLATLMPKWSFCLVAMVTSLTPNDSRFTLHSPTWFLCFSLPEPFFSCPYSSPLEPRSISVPMEASVPIICHRLRTHSKLSGIRHLLCLRSYGSGIQAGTRSFHSTMTGTIAGWFEWLETPAMAHFRPYVWGLCYGCWLYSLILVHITSAGAGISKMASPFTCLLSALGWLECWG